MIEWHCDAVLFDLDGVLVDSSACVERHWRGWALEHGLSLEEIMRVAHGYRTVDTMRLVAPHLAVEQEADRFDTREALDAEGVVKTEGAAELVCALPAQRWAVVTSGTRSLAMTRLKHTALPVPPVLITADDVRLGKPHPEAYLLASARLGLTPETCIVVEDAPAGIKAAHAAGMRVVAVATTHREDDLGEADARAMRLTAIQIASSSVGPNGRLRVQVTEI
jgi:mannitol-1-/sugar-/sorbitol-6-phosphatase